MNKKLLLSASLLMTLLLSACSDSSDDDDSGTTGTIRFVNAITDAPYLYLYRDEGDVDDDILVEGADFGHGSALLSTGVGTIDFVVYRVIEDELDDVGFRFEATLEAGTQLLIIVYGTMDDPQTLLVEAPDFDNDEDTSRVGIVGLSQKQPAIDLYLTSGNDGVFDSSVIATANYGEFSGLVELDDGDYNVILTIAGDTDRSYEGGEVTLDEDTNVIYAVVDAFGVAESSIVLIEMEDSNTSDTLSNDDNADTPLAIRFVNAIPDNAYDSIDIYFGDTSGDPLFEAVEFTQATAYLELLVDDDEFPDYDLVVTPTGLKTEFFLQRSLSLSRDIAYSLVITGLSDDDEVSSRLHEVDLRAIDGQARVTFVHASPSSIDQVDFFLLERGQPVDDGTAISTGIDYLLSVQGEVESGDYDIYIVDSEDEDVALVGPIRITLEDGDNISFHLIDQAGSGVDLLEVDNSL